MGNLVMYLQRVIVLIVSIFFLLPADMANHVLEVNVSPELVFVEKMSLAELAVGMHEGHVSELVDVSLL